MSPVSIFISYDQKDKEASKAVQRQLVILRRKKVIVFQDQQELEITTTDRWDSIELALKKSSIILLILSGHFIDSDECYEIQELALTYAQEGSAILIPILYSRCSWTQLDGISRLQPLPRSRAFIKDLPNPDNAYADIAQEVGSLAQKIHEGKLQLKPKNIGTTTIPEPLEQDPKTLIKSGNIRAALVILDQKTEGNPDLSSQVTNLQSQLSTLEDKIRKNIISAANETLLRNTIVNAALEIIDEL